MDVIFNHEFAWGWFGLINGRRYINFGSKVANSATTMKLQLSKFKAWAKCVKLDVVALWIAARDPRVPWLAKLVAGAVAAYALSPIDLIPDFIPVLGFLDDLIIVPLGILLAIRLVPDDLMEEFRDEAACREARPRSLIGLMLIVTIWVVSAAWLMWFFWPLALHRSWTPI